MRNARQVVFADLALARRLEATEAAACVDTARSVAKLHPEMATASDKIAGGWAVFTGVGSPISEARGLGMNGPVTQGDLERLEEFYLSRGDGVRMEVCPFSNVSLHQLLARRGYRLAEFSNMLAKPMKKERGVSRPPSSALRIGGLRRAGKGAKRQSSQRRREKPIQSKFKGVGTRRIEAGEGELWAETVAQCFAEHMPITQELMDIMSCWARSPMAVCYFGYVDGELAGGGAVAIHRGVALFGGAGTAPKFRGRGLQQALILARLEHAAEAGCDLAMTVTLPGSVSQRNCERHGFRVAYTRAKFMHD